MPQVHPRCPLPVADHFRKPARCFPFLLIAVLLLAAAVIVVSPSEATETDGMLHGGVIVRGTDPEVTMPYQQILTVTVCWTNMAGTDQYSAMDPVLLTFQSPCTGNSQSDHIRLATWNDHAAGSRVGSAPDLNVPLRSLTPEPLFYHHNVDGNNHLSPGDTLYLRMQQADVPHVQKGDVRITAFGDHPAGSRVQPADPDFNRAIAPLGTASEILRHVDVLNTNMFHSRDSFYITTDSTRTAAGLGDVRIYTPEPSLPFGAFLAPGDPDTSDAVRKVTRPLCYVDGGQTGEYTPGVDALYLSVRTACTGTVEAGDLRLSTTSRYEAGSRVERMHDDHGGQYATVHARVGYINMDQDNRLSPGDLVVLNIIDSAAHVIRPGDVLLTPTARGAGIVIESGDELVGRQIVNIGEFQHLVVFKPTSATTTLSRHDPLYLSPETSTGQGLRPGDVRLVPAGDHPFGGPVGVGTGETLTTLQREGGNVCSTRSIPSEYLPGDPVYLRLDGACPSTVQAGLIRLVPIDVYQAFTTVNGGDSDTGRILFTPAVTPQVRFVTSGQVDWATHSWVYLNLVSPQENKVRLGDIRLTSYQSLPPGIAVHSGDGDIAISDLSTIGPIDGITGFVDVDRDGRFTNWDHAYITPTTVHNHVIPLSLRVTALPADFVAPKVVNVTDEGVKTDDETHIEMENGQVTDSEPPGIDKGEIDDNRENGRAPGPALVGVLVGIFVIVLWRADCRK